MRGSSEHRLQLTFERFSVACDQAGMKISTKQIEALCLSRRPRQCILQVGGNALQQVEYFGVVFMSDQSRNKGIDTRIEKANAVPRELYRSVVTKRELSNAAKLSVFRWVFVPILTYGHES